jgi:hypothetical protein
MATNESHESLEHTTVICVPSTSRGNRSLVNRVMSNGKGPKIWYEGNMYRIRKKPNPSTGVKYAYWDCAYSGCRVTCRKAGVGTLDGFEYGRTRAHSHNTVSAGEMIRLEMLEKGKIRKDLIIKGHRSLIKPSS